MKNRFRKFIYVIILLLVVILLFYIIKAINIMQNKHKNYMEDKRIEEIQQEKENRVADVVENKEKIQKDNKTINAIKEEKEILAEYEDLYKQNNDLYGWIKIEGTNMNYPVMYTPKNPNFYINRDFDKNIATKGSIYISGVCKVDDENLIIYGHNSKDLSMFGCLSYYKQESYYQSHKYIQLDTIYEKGTYEIIAVSKAFIRKEDLMESEDGNQKNDIPFYELNDDDYLFYMHMKLNNEEEFEEYVNNMKGNSYYQINATAEYGNKLITLCTCTNVKNYQNERLLVVAKKIE